MSGTINCVELLRKAQLGDRESMSRLARLARGRLFAYLFRLTLNNDLAQDLSQETLLTMVRSLKRLNFEHASQFWSWLFQTASGKAQTYFRNRQQEKMTQMSGFDAEQFLSECTSRDHCEGLQNLMRKELSAAIFKAMGKLRARHRNVLILRCFEQMPYSEIASIMNCNELTAQVLFFRAKHSLKRQLARHGFGKAWLLAALGVFARLTTPAKASSAATTVAATSTKVGVTATVIGAVGTKLGIAAATAVTAAAITVGGIAITAINDDNVVKKPQVTFLNPTPDGDDRFGYPIIAVGDNTLIGARRDDAGATDAGAVYLFDANGVLLQTFLNPTPETKDSLGWAIAAVGSNVLVGAPGDNSGGTDAGAVYLFDPGGALLQTFLNPTPGAGKDWFGWAVASLGSNTLVGAPGDDAAGSNAGAVYLFDPSAVLLHTILNPTPGAGNDWFGCAVAALGSNILVGAPRDDLGGRNVGAVYLFDPGGTLLQTFLNPTPAAGDLFGYRVAALGDNVLVSAPLDDAGTRDAGVVYLFDESGALLQAFPNPTPETEDWFGWAVAALGSNILVGAPRDDVGGTDAGAVYLFAPDGSLLHTFLNPTPRTDGRFGSAVAAMGNKVLIGAPWHNSGKNHGGAAYLFEVPVLNKDEINSTSD